MNERLPRYRVLTGPDDDAFCHRVSAALAEGYALHAGPALTFSPKRGVIVAQAVLWAGPGEPPALPLQPEARPAPGDPVLPASQELRTAESATVRITHPWDSSRMAAYLIVNVTATGSAQKLAEYRDRVGATVAQFGGRYLARSTTPDVLEGDWSADQVVLVEFPDLKAARAWNASPEYRAIAPLRTENAASVRLVVEGLE